MVAGPVRSGRVDGRLRGERPAGAGLVEVLDCPAESPRCSRRAPASRCSAASQRAAPPDPGRLGLRRARVDGRAGGAQGPRRHRHPRPLGHPAGGGPCDLDRSGRGRRRPQGPAHSAECRSRAPGRRLSAPWSPRPAARSGSRMASATVSAWRSGPASWMRRTSAPVA